MWMEHAYDTCFYFEFIYITGNTTALKFATGFYSIMKIDKTKYYRYNGSMPLPPCNEVCIWTLFSETNSVSSEQVIKQQKSVLYV